MRRPAEFISINHRIKQELNKQKIVPSVFARTIGVSLASILRLLNSDTCSVHRLAQYSKVLNYNFFAEIGEKLNIASPESKKIAPLNNEIEILKNELSAKEQEIVTLKRMIKLVTGKNTDEI